MLFQFRGEKAIQRLLISIKWLFSYLNLVLYYNSFEFLCQLDSLSSIVIFHVKILKWHCKKRFLIFRNFLWFKMNKLINGLLEYRADPVGEAWPSQKARVGPISEQREEAILGIPWGRPILSHKYALCTSLRKVVCPKQWPQPAGRVLLAAVGAVNVVAYWRC